MYIDKITINEPLSGGVKEFKVFDEKQYDKRIKKNNNKLLNAVLFLTSNGEYTTTTSWPVNETGNHLIMDSNGVKAITSWDAENGYRKIIYNRDPLLYIYCDSPSSIHLNGEDINLPVYDNYFEIDKIEQGSTFVTTSGNLKAIIARECKLPSSLKGLFFDYIDGPTFASYIEIVIDDTVIDMGEAFCYSTFNTINASNWDTSKVTDMGSMFYECNNLTTLDLSNWDTSNVTNMDYIFQNCSKLEPLDLSNWDTSKVTDMGSMFSSCSSLQSLNLSNWDTSKITDMRYIFSGCSSLQSLNLSNWDTSKVTDMRSMFDGCSSLQSLNLSNFDTSNVTDIRWMFSDCDSLQSLIFPGMGKIKTSGKIITLHYSPLDHDSLMSIFTYNRAEAGLSALTVQLTELSNGYLTDEEKAEITAKGYTIA